MDSLHISTSEEEKSTPEIMHTEKYVNTEKVEPETSKKKYYRETDEVITKKLSVFIDECSITERDAI